MTVLCKYLKKNKAHPLSFPNVNTREKQMQSPVCSRALTDGGWGLETVCLPIMKIAGSKNPHFFGWGKNVHSL